jgi:hypothetical protein
MTRRRHGGRAKRSIVYVRWEHDPEKSLGLPVPFGCSMNDLKNETEKAVKALSTERASATVASP